MPDTETISVLDTEMSFRVRNRSPYVCQLEGVKQIKMETNSMSDTEVRVCVISREFAWTQKQVSMLYTEARVCTISSRGDDSGEHEHQRSPPPQGKDGWGGSAAFASLTLLVLCSSLLAGCCG